MGKHYNKKNLNYLKTLEKDGFTCKNSGNNGSKVYISKGDGERYLIHTGERAFHPLRRWLKNTYDYILIT